MEDQAAEAVEDQAVEDQAVEAVEDQAAEAAEDQAADPEAEETAEEAPSRGPPTRWRKRPRKKTCPRTIWTALFDEAPGEDAEAPAPESAEEPDEEPSEESAEESDADDAGAPADAAADAEPDDAAPDTVEVPKDLPDAEPVPEVFEVGKSDEEAEGARGGAKKIVGIIAAVLVVGLLAGGYFGRQRVVSVWPGAEPYYAMLGIPTDVLAAGLAIRGVKWERTAERGTPLLVIRGIIANVADGPRPVPWIQVTLHDARDEELQRLVFPPEEDQVAAGQSMIFKARIKGTAGHRALARRHLHPRRRKGRRLRLRAENRSNGKVTPAKAGVQGIEKELDSPLARE